MRKLNVVVYEEESAFVAQCLNCGVTTHGDTYEEAIENIQEAVELFYEDNKDGVYSHIGAMVVTEIFVNA